MPQPEVELEGRCFAAKVLYFTHLFITFVMAEPGQQRNSTKVLLARLA